MRERLELRLKELREELGSGQKLMVDLDGRRAELQATMMRIAGAIQVIEELLVAEVSPARTPLVTVPPVITAG